METIDITKLLEVIILAIVAPFVPIIANRVKRWLDANISREQEAAIFEVVRLAVLATEQVGLNGEEARAHAIALAEDFLAARGIAVDFKRLGLVVEAVVMDEFNKWRAALPPDSGESSGA